MSRKNWEKWVQGLTDGDQKWAMEYLSERAASLPTWASFKTRATDIMSMIQYLESSTDGLRILNKMDNYHRHKRSKKANKKRSTTIYLSQNASGLLKKLARQANRNLSDTVEYLINKESSENLSQK